jgi:hypothetical protein
MERGVALLLSLEVEDATPCVALSLAPTVRRLSDCKSGDRTTHIHVRLFRSYLKK